MLIAAQRGDREAALREAQLEPDPGFRRFRAGGGTLRPRRSGGSRRRTRRPDRHMPGEGFAYQIAEVYAVRGETDKAFEWLQTAFDDRDAGMLGLLRGPVIAGLARRCSIQELARQSRFTHNAMSHKRSFFSELRRRNVFRVALTYAVVAWLLIEIASVLLPLIDAPESIITAFVVLLALGFAVALFISWEFEMTPEGLKRTQDLSPDEVIPYWSRRKFAKFIIGVAGTAFCLSAYHLLFPAPARNFSQSEPVSISQSSPSSSEKPSGVEQLASRSRCPMGESCSS